MMTTPALVPSLTAPAPIMRCASAAVRMPPDALTPTLASRQSRRSSTSLTVAPCGPSPVDVLTKSTPTCSQIRQAIRLNRSSR